MPDNKCKLFFALFFICFIMPVFIFYSGYSYYKYLNIELKKSKLLTLAGTISSKIANFINNRSYWCYQFNQAMHTSRTKEEVAAKFKAKLKNKKQKAKWVVWNKKWQFVNSQDFKRIDKLDPAYTGKTIREAMRRKGDTLNYSDKIYLKKLIGPHIFFNRMVTPLRNDYPDFLETNFKENASFYWGNYTDEFTAFALFPSSVENKKHGLFDFINQFKNQYPGKEIFIIQDNRIYNKADEINIGYIGYLKRRFGTSEESIFLDNSRLYYGEQLIEDTFLIIADDSPVKTGADDKTTALFTLIWVFFNLLFFQNFSFLKTTNNLKVRQAIYGFIGLSNILPLIILVIFTSRYMEQKYLVMIDNKKIQAVDFLHGIEEEFLNVIKRFPYNAKQVIKKNSAMLQKGNLNIKQGRKLKKDFDKYDLDFNIVASRAMTLITNEVIINENKSRSLKRGKNNNQTKKLADVIRKIGNCYLAFLNNTKVSQTYLTELELISDMIFQKSIEETLHYFVELSDNIANFGFGTFTIPSFSYLIRDQKSNIYNYFCIFQFRIDDSAYKFLESIKTSRLANHYGLKVIFRDGPHLYAPHIYPFKKSKKLAQLLGKLKIYPSAKAAQVVLDGKKWIYTGYKSTIMKSIELAAFYPLSEIHRKLNKEKSDLITLFVANLLIILAIAYFFSKTLLTPIQYLKKGTEAINSRNFTYRLPSLGKDEFGKMADIFNTAISDLEELSVGGVVQQSLFPKSKIDTGNYDLFGQSNALADLGGDYLDYFDIDAENFGVILGDVAGHGVGAALIMAIAKSTTINSTDYYKKPVEFTSRLHQLIYSSKTRKQKKIMTFQYLLVNKNANSLMFCNAGGCNPFIVNGPQSKVEEIKLPAPALGAFKKARYKDRQITFAPGDVMVLYTDGIVEARNKDNQEIGYDLFKEILLKNYTTDPELYYSKVLKEYHNWLGETEAEDDLTMIFLTMKPEA